MNLDLHIRDAALRWQNCLYIANLAALHKLNVRPEFVRRHYRAFTDWYEGRMPIERLITITGVDTTNKENT